MHGHRSGRHSHSQQAQSEPNRARDIGPRMLTSQPSAYLMTMELHRRRRASRGQSKPFDEMRLSTCRGARSTAAAQRQSAEGSRSTAGSSHRSARSYRRAESRHAKDQQIDQHSQLFRKPGGGYFIRSCKSGFATDRAYALTSSGKQSGAPGASECSRPQPPARHVVLGPISAAAGGGRLRMVKCSYAH